MNKWQDYPGSAARLHNLSARFVAEFREPPSSIAGLRKAGTSAHSLSVTVKELVALAMAVASGSENRIRWHVQSARRMGATRREITDTVALAVLVGGKALALAGDQALQALEQFESLSFYCRLAETGRARRMGGYLLVH